VENKRILKILMKNKKQRQCTALLLAGLMAAGALLAGCDGNSGMSAVPAAAESSGSEITETGEPLDWTGTYFDTVISLRIYGSEAEKWMKGAVAICQQMEDTLSAQKKDAELYAVNHRTSQSMEISDELADCIAAGLKYSQMSEGAFDITILPVKDLWNFESEDHKGIVPDQADIAEALKKVDYRKVHLDGNTISFDSPDTEIDLGGIAKGYISGKLCEYLESEGCRAALINLGGNVRAIGTKPDGTDWTVGIQTPFDDRGTVLTTVSTADDSVISSGIYERYFKKDGKIYHHILDPRTGYPAETDLNQVTVLGEDDAAGDALATIGIVLGQEGMKDFLQKNHLTDTATVLFTDKDNAYTWYPSAPGGAEDEQ